MRTGQEGWGRISYRLHDVGRNARREASHPSPTGLSDSELYFLLHSSRLVCGAHLLSCYSNLAVRSVRLHAEHMEALKYSSAARDLWLGLLA